MGVGRHLAPRKSDFRHSANLQILKLLAGQGADSSVEEADAIGPFGDRSERPGAAMHFVLPMSEMGGKQSFAAP